MKQFRYLANLEIVFGPGRLGRRPLGPGSRPENHLLQYLYFFAWYPLSRFSGRPPVPSPGRVLAPDSAPRFPPDVFLVRAPSGSCFEAFNLVLHNWGYVAVAPALWVRWGGYALAFATVLPGVLLTAEVLEALGVWKRR